MNDLCERMRQGALFANDLCREDVPVIYKLELTDYGVRCRGVYATSDVSRFTFQYEVPYGILESAYANPIVEALKLVRREILDRQQRPLP